MPAEAPATACCQSGRGARPSSDVVGRFWCLSDEGEEVDSGVFLELRWRNSKVTVSLLPNQAAQPPVSRMSVPNCPFQNPRRPWCLKTSRMTAIGVGERCTIPSVLALAGTWILHLTSSTGVRTRLVNAPEMAPVSQSAERGSGFSRW